MAEYNVTVLIDCSHMVTVEAESPEEAREIAEVEVAGSSGLCHHCSDRQSLGDPFDSVVCDEDGEEVLGYARDEEHAAEIEKARREGAEEAQRELAAARAELALLRPVVEAARDVSRGVGGDSLDRLDAAFAALDASTP